MSRHIHITCPNCRRADLRIRPEVIGRRVECKYCQHVFRAQPADDAREPVTRGRQEVALPEPNIPEEEIQKIRSELGARTAGHAAAVRQLDESQRRLEPLEGQVRALQTELDAARTRIEELETQLQDRSAAPTAPPAHAAEALVQERDRIAIERDQLRDELSAVRSDLEARLAEAGERRARLAEDAERVRGERDRIERERDRLHEDTENLRAQITARSAEVERLAELTAGLEAARARADDLETGQRHAVSDAEQARGRLEDLERTLAAAVAEHEEARGAWESERRRLLEKWDEERRTLVDDAERRSREQRGSQRREDEERIASLQHENTSLRADVEAADRARDEARRQADEVRAERDHLQARLADESAAHEAAQRDRDADGHQHRRALEALQEELRAERKARETHQTAWRQAENERDGLGGQAERLQAMHDALRREADALGRERDRLDTELAEVRLRLGQDDELRAERDRAAAALEVAQQEAKGAAERGEGLEAQLSALGGERDRLRQDHEAAVEGLRHELEAARAELGAERERTAAGEAARTELQRRLADALRDQRAAVARAEQLETEVRELRDRWRERPEGPTDLAAAGERSSASARHAEDRDQRIDELTRQLRLAQEGNERLRAFLAVFGAHRQTIGNDSG
jgi:chromosome segregation ATPase